MSRITGKIILVSVLILLFPVNSMAETKSDAKAHKEQGDLIKFGDSQELGPYKVRVLETAKVGLKKVGYNVFICQFEIKNIHKEQIEIEIDPENVKVIAPTGEKYGPPFGGALDLDIASAYIEGKLEPDISSAVIIKGSIEVRKIGRDSRFKVSKEEGKERWFIVPSKESPTKFAIFFMIPKDIQLKELHWEGLKPFSLQTSTAETKSDAKTHKEKGAAYTMEGKYDKAIEEFSKAISLDPNDAETYTARGFVYRGKG
jgi:tetratricopeptide (TPR) repeat protein